MRKPYPHILLTCSECDLLDLLATKSKIDVWFSLVETTDFDGTKHTLVFDLERNRMVSLQFGVRLLLEGVSFGYVDFAKEYGLNTREMKLLTGIVKKLNISRYFQ